MPIVRTTLVNGFASTAQKGEIAQRTTDVVADVLGEMTRPYIFSLVDEIAPGALTVGGVIMTDEIERNGIMMSQNWREHRRLTAERVRQAYAALAGGESANIEEYWDAEMTWLVPGDAPVSGLKQGREEFLQFMKTIGELSGNSFQMEWKDVLVSGDLSVDITHNTGNRAGDTKRKLDIDVVHVLRWREGKVVEGRGAIFGGGTAQYSEFWR
jgi:ketosteroid isomerase-like protein/phenylpyruvate tautomerase PptA (4-oxalocrotonate tautomerase family)